MSTMNISLPGKLKEWAEAQVKTGRYADVSDVIRDLIRKEQDRAAALEDIRTALTEGDASGYSAYSRDKVMTSLAIAARGHAD